jgi:hypothetical protein
MAVVIPTSRCISAIFWGFWIEFQLISLIMIFKVEASTPARSMAELLREFFLADPRLRSRIVIPLKVSPTRQKARGNNLRIQPEPTEGPPEPTERTSQIGVLVVQM